MGMESFGGDDEAVVVEGAERVEDKEKAEAMARNSDIFRSQAAEERKVASGETPILGSDSSNEKVVWDNRIGRHEFEKSTPNSEIKEEFAQRAIEHDKDSERLERMAAEKFDAEKNGWV